MADQDDLWTQWIGFDSPNCWEHNIIHTASCEYHTYQQDDFLHEMGDMFTWLDAAASCEIIDPAAEAAITYTRYAMENLATCVRIAFHAAFDCRVLIGGLGAPEPEPGETLYHLLDDLKGTP